MNLHVFVFLSVEKYANLRSNLTIDHLLLFYQKYLLKRLNKDSNNKLSLKNQKYLT